MHDSLQEQKRPTQLEIKLIFFKIYHNILKIEYASHFIRQLMKANDRPG